MEELAEILEQMHPDVDVRKEKALATDKILDSFDIITLLAEIHERFDVVVPAVEITEENFDSIERMYALITRLSEE